MGFSANTLPPILSDSLKFLQNGRLPPVRKLIHRAADSNTLPPIRHNTLPPIRHDQPFPGPLNLPPIRQHFPDQPFPGPLSLPPIRQHVPDQPFPGPLRLRNIENRPLSAEEVEGTGNMARAPQLVQLQNVQWQPIAPNGNGPRGMKRTRDKEESEVTQAEILESFKTTKKAREQEPEHVKNGHWWTQEEEDDFYV
ncbi:hypothetical protein DFP72DRAFT_1073626 [Ephemerocybe angulata]|uniref:Uncharacterized protein n=1 Tax=Ephemerocybe angulata TaxID=980116 RepID=A0A8H6HMS7_9AGAR|nr:hypothetical protein DFP72DRAFT_1073626 [Tulosesus angulatus]